MDRGALDAALSLRVPCGGWCPAGRKAEDGAIPERYPLKELPGGGCIERTRKNVEDSDATLIVTFGPATGGTADTLGFCRQLGKPHLVIDAEVASVGEGAWQAFEFVRSENAQRLNLAGPRASHAPRGYQYTFELVRRLLEALG